MRVSGPLGWRGPEGPALEPREPRERKRGPPCRRLFFNLVFAPFFVRLEGEIRNLALEFNGSRTGSRRLLIPERWHRQSDGEAQRLYDHLTTRLPLWPPATAPIDRRSDLVALLRH